MGAVMSLRRRRAPEDLGSELEQPLLATSSGATGLEGTSAAAAGASTARPPSAVVRALRGMCAALAAAWRYLLGLVQRLLAGGRVHPLPPLEPLEQERLQHLRERAAVPFDEELEEHQAALQALWAAAFGASTPFPPGIKHPQWKEMGWQGEHPGTDFRGAGFISLQALLWMARERHETFLHLMHKKAGSRSSWEYPFAAGGVNIAYMLTEVLGLRRQGSSGGAGGSSGSDVEPAIPPAARGFAPLLGQSDTAFEELFVLAFRLLDSIWLERGASYMEFPQVMRDVRLRVEQSLASRRAGTMAELQEMLLLQPNLL